MNDTERRLPDPRIVADVIYESERGDKAALKMLQDLRACKGKKIAY